VRLLAGHVGCATAVAFSPDGEMVATGGEDGTVRLWRSRLGSVIRTIRAHTREVAAVQFSHDGAFVFSGGDRAIRVWRVSDGRPEGKLGRLRTHGRAVTSLSLSPDGFRLASGGGDNAVKLWDLAGGRRIGTHARCHGSLVLSVGFSRDGTILATGGDTGEVRMLDYRPPAWIEREGPLPRLEPLAGLTQVSALAFSPDATMMAAAGHVKTGEAQSNGAPSAYAVWSISDGKLLKSFPGSQGSAVAFSPDGKYLAAADAYDSSQVLRLEDRLVVATYGVSRCIAFSPDGGLLAVGHESMVALHPFGPE
jgi:WD40 repeat protein